jgi:dipeptidyl aminopeptidase/acylaminoacyl peptidase
MASHHPLRGRLPTAAALAVAAYLSAEDRSVALRYRLTASAVQAPGRQPMTLLDVVQVPRLLDAQLAPDGRSVIYMLSRADWKANRQVAHFWKQEIGGGPPRQLTFSEAGEAGGRWSPDGKSLLFGRGGQIYLMPADGGEPRQLTRHATSVASPAWTPDGAAIFFVAADARAPEESARERAGDDLTAFEEHPKQRHLWKVVVSTGGEEQLTHGESSILSYRISRDGTKVAVVRAPTPFAADAVRAEIWTIDADGRSERVLTHNAVEETEAELSPDNSQLLFVAEANAQLEPYYASAVFVMPATGGHPRLVAPEFPYHVERAAWAPDGKSILAVANMGLHSEIVSLDLAGHAREITSGRHSVQFWSVQPSAGRMVFQLDEPERLGDVWTVPLTGGALTRVTSQYDSLASEFELPRQEKIEWKAPDGATIEGLLFYPIGYEPGKRWPLVVQMHGGPGESDRYGFGPGFIQNYVPVLTAKGYAVLRPNYRGSIGYGSAFMRDPVGKYFRHMHVDVLAGVDALIRQGLADPDRLIAMGWSAGGHLTNKLITFTGRFKAASSGAGVADWVSMYGQSATRAERTVWFGGTPYQKNAPIDLYWDESPLKFAAQVTTPTLFFVGADDFQVPKEQALEMFRALKANNVPTKLYIAPGEQHTWIGLRHLFAKANAELEWFEKYAMGRPYVPEKVPGDGEKSPRSQP